MAKIFIAGTDRVLEAPVGTSLLEVLQEASHPIATSCGGVATCGLCRLTVKSGKEHLSAICSGEITHLGTVAKIIGLRLACQARLMDGGEVHIQVPEVEDVAARKAAKAVRLRQARVAAGGGRR
jgi:2Fe-2S ferredoxin